MSSSFTDDTIDPKRDFIVRSNTNYRATRYPSSVAGRSSKPEIKAFNQLSYLEKMMVMTAFRNGVVKFIKMWQMQDYIYITTKINISTKLLFEVRRKDLNERYVWYYNFARDSHAYIAAYSKAIDEIETYKEELWNLILYKTKDERIKMDAFKELHNLTKSGVILLKELPFLTQLSKFYDLTKLDPQRVGIGRLQHDKLDSSNRGLPSIESNEYYKYHDLYNENNSSTIMAVTERIKDKHHLTKDDMNNKILSELPDTEINKENEKTADKYLDKQMKDIEKEMQTIMNATDIDETKKANELDNIKKKYYESMKNFEDILTPEKRQTISLLKSLEEENSEGSKDNIANNDAVF